MVHILRFIAALVRWFRRSPAEREAEIVYLRQQLVVLKRTAPARPGLEATERLMFVCLYRLFPSLIDASIVFQPETSCAGTELAFACSGLGSRGGRLVALPCRPISEVLFGAAVERPLHDTLLMFGTGSPCRPRPAAIQRRSRAARRPARTGYDHTVVGTVVVKLATISKRARPLLEIFPLLGGGDLRLTPNKRLSDLAVDPFWSR
jgi:hypothetical protein